MLIEIVRIAVKIVCHEKSICKKLDVHNQYLCIPFARTNYYKSSLSVYGPSIWNKIPLNIREAQNVHTFKILLKEWIISLHNM